MIERKKQSALLGIKYDMDDIERNKDKEIKALLKEITTIKHQIQQETDIQFKLRLNLKSAKEDLQRLQESKRTNTGITKLNATVATSAHEDNAAAKKRS